MRFIPGLGRAPMFALGVVASFCLASGRTRAASEIKDDTPAALPLVAEKTDAATSQVAPPPAEGAPQTGPADLIPPGAGTNTPSFNVTINLINRLVQKGLLTKEDAADLLKQAEADAA